MGNNPQITTTQLRALIASGANRDELPESGSTIMSTRESFRISFDEAMRRAAITEAFKIKNHQYAINARNLESKQLALERATSNSIANADIQEDRVHIVNSTIINPPTAKYLDQFAEGGSIAYYVPKKSKEYGFQENNNTPIIQTPLVNFSGIGSYGDVQTSTPTKSTTTQQNNKNNASTTPVNKTNLIPSVNYLPVNTTELNQIADGKRLPSTYVAGREFSQKNLYTTVEPKLNFTNIAIVGAAAAIITGAVIKGSKS